MKNSLYLAASLTLALALGCSKGGQPAQMETLQDAVAVPTETSEVPANSEAAAELAEPTPEELP